MENKEKMIDYLKILDMRLDVREQAVINCLKEHLGEYLGKVDTNKAIQKVIDNYRIERFYEELLDNRIINNDKFEEYMKNDMCVDVKSYKKLVVNSEVLENE